MIYKTIIIEDSFAAGLAVGSARAFLSANGAGNLFIKGIGEGCVYVEFSAYNPLVMSYIEDMLAEFV